MTEHDGASLAEADAALLRRLPARAQQIARRLRRFHAGGWDINGLLAVHGEALALQASGLPSDTGGAAASLQRIAELVEEWEHPAYLEWGERTAWRLFNVTTHVLAGRLVENSDLTPRLHTIIDGVCERKGVLVDATG